MEWKEDRWIQYLRKGVSPYHVVETAAEDFRKNGFLELFMGEPWELKEYGRYFIRHHGTTLLAFTLPAREAMLQGEGKPLLRIAASHTDFPCLRIKPQPDYECKGYRKINTEVYGGAILNTWLDRPLGVAGRIAMRSGQCLAPETMLYDSKRPVLVIPNLAIHMNREINKGVELNKQTELAPVFGMKEDSGSFMDFLAEETGAAREDILDFELSVYNADEPVFVGGAQEMLSAPRIDNIISCAAMTEALLQSTKAAAEDNTHISLAVFFDHEEVGSRTKQGAGSAFLADVLEKIYESMGWTRRQAKDAVYQGLFLSVDVAHALHPNHTDKNDITNEPVLQRGFVIKEASGQTYATDCEAVAMVMQLADSNRIPWQKYVNRSDIPGGGTLGSISSALLPMRTVDIGVPILAMHSARELMGVRDYDSLRSILAAFYREA